MKDGAPRKCNVCGETKPLTEFPRNRTRPLGREYVCLVCDRLRKREERRREKLPGKEQLHDSRPMMADEVFAVFYRDRELRDRLIECAKLAARGDEDRASDLLQVGWLHVAMCKPGRTMDYYCEVAEKAIERERWKWRCRREYSLDAIECMSHAEFSMWSRGHY